MKNKALLVLGLMLLLASAVSADISKTFTYQGRLMDATGKAVADADNRVVIISLYDSPQTSVLWTKTFNAVPTRNGYFSLTLGDTTPQWLALDFNQQYYIGTQIGGDPAELLPRQPLGAAPYAMNVPDASVTTAKLQAAAVTGAKVSTTAGQRIGTTNIEDLAITSAKLGNTAVTNGKLADNSVSTAKIQDGAVTQVKAAFAPKVAVNGAWRNSPIIACGMGTTNTDGNMQIDLLPYGFTQTPAITCTPIHDSLQIAITLYPVNLSAAGFGICSRLNNNVGGMVNFYWIAIGY